MSGGTGDTGGGSDSNAASAGSAKWRCAWCEKPQQRNDPPCDSCGHHKFERAVVPVAPDDPDHVREPVWVCPECGRQHQKNSPPCSRCGNATLEKHVPEDDDFADELGGTSYFDVLEPQYVAGFAVALVALGVLVLATLGVITLPGMGGQSLDVSNVPGTANASNGVTLSEAEAGYLDRVNDLREAAGVAPLERNARLDEVATYANQREVKSVYGDGTTPSREQVSRAVGDACRGEGWVLARFSRPLAGNESAFASADSLAAALSDEYADRVDELRSFPTGRVGVDVHVGPDGRVFVTQIAC